MTTLSINVILFSVPLSDVKSLQTLDYSVQTADSLSVKEVRTLVKMKALLAMLAIVVGIAAGSPAAGHARPGFVGRLVTQLARRLPGSIWTGSKRGLVVGAPVGLAIGRHVLGGFNGSRAAAAKTYGRGAVVGSALGSIVGAYVGSQSAIGASAFDAADLNPTAGKWLGTFFSPGAVAVSIGVNTANDLTDFHRSAASFDPDVPTRYDNVNPHRSASSFDPDVPSQHENVKSSTITSVVTSKQVAVGLTSAALIAGAALAVIPAMTYKRHVLATQHRPTAGRKSQKQSIQNGADTYFHKLSVLAIIISSTVVSLIVTL